ncbi:MAG: hypothetical protein ACRD3O_11115 [Terriglobia bacterium]
MFEFAVISLSPVFLRDTFTANVASPPVETAPATTNPMVAKQSVRAVLDAALSFLESDRSSCLRQLKRIAGNVDACLLDCLGVQEW